MIALIAVLGFVFLPPAGMAVIGSIQNRSFRKWWRS